MLHAIVKSGLLAATILGGAGMLAPLRAADEMGRIVDTVISDGVPAQAGLWRTRVQNVFDAGARDLATRSYTAFDPAPERNLEFVWLPDDPLTDRPGKINGMGRLTWRQAGIAGYNPSAIHSVYTGAMRDGHLHGRGRLEMADGAIYTGAFLRGRFEGQGLLRLANGEEYQGSFRAGIAAGQGGFTDLSGERFEGQFVAGLRHGAGRTILPGGLAYQSRWNMGAEVPGSVAVRVAQLGAQPPGPASADTIRLGVSVQRKPKNAELEPGEMLGYVTSASGETLLIRPDDAQLVSVWKNGGTIEPNVKALKMGSMNRSGLFDFDKDLVFPPTLVFEIQNKSTARVEITDFYIDVKQSVSDMQPALQLEAGYAPGDCSGGTVTPDEKDKGAFIPKMTLRNYGWGQVEQATYQFGFAGGGASATGLSKSIPKFDTSATFDLTDQLAKAGANITLLKRYARSGFRCNSKDSATCLGELKATGAFGALADKIRIKGNAIQLIPDGRLDYSYKDVAGQMKTASAPMRGELTIGGLIVQAECGAGGPPELARPKPVELKLDQSNYRLPIPLRRAIDPGRNHQFTLALVAARSSNHDFQVVAKLSDGREIRSRPVNLLYFKPREPAS